MILFECPGMIGPLDTATLARRIIPFWGRERYDSRISEQKILPMDRQGLLDYLESQLIIRRYLVAATALIKGTR